MLVKRLSWAGVLVQGEDATILIDAITGITEQTKTVLGEPKGSFIPFSSLTNVSAVLHTHTHNDHFDPNGIMANFGADMPVFVPDESVHEAVETGLKDVTGARVGSSFRFGSLTVTATFSVDGFGSPQVAWVVEENGKRIIHSGDTLWHGFWWKIVRTFGEFDVAFLPVNGAVITLPSLSPSHQLACMNPEQAAAAARLLGAKKLVPIHYGTFHNAPHYIETDNVLPRLQTAADHEGIRVSVLESGQTLDI